MAHFGMVDAKNNKMEDWDNRMEDGLPSLYLNSIIPHFTTAYKLCETKLQESFFLNSLLELNAFTFVFNLSDRRQLSIVNESLNYFCTTVISLQLGRLTCTGSLRMFRSV